MRYYRYQLCPKTALNAKTAPTTIEGVLLQSDEGGYSCLQPWTCFGDASLSDELQAMQGGHALPLGKRALRCMQLDAEARAAGHSIFDGLNIPLSHASLGLHPNAKQVKEMQQRGFTIGKLKASADLPLTNTLLLELSQAVPEWKWRLDFNASLNVKDALRWWQQLPDKLRQVIELIEDPCPYRQQDWYDLQKIHMPLACDWEISNPTHCHLQHIIKPASQEARGESPIFTSSMDHPLGQAWAAYCAASFYKDKNIKTIPICGLVTQHLFEENDFSALLGSEAKPQFTVPAGTGLGFDTLLAKLDWKKL